MIFIYFYPESQPIDFTGNLNQPKWGHLKDLHTVLKSMEETLTEGNITTIDMGNSVEVIFLFLFFNKFCVNCFF